MAQTNLEVGYGMAKGKDALEVGKKAARQALEAIKEHPLSLVQVFASPHYDPEALLRGIRQVVGPAPLIGTSAARGICNGVQHRAVVVLALASPYLRVKVAVGGGVSQDWQRSVIEAITAPEIAPYFY
ncbi:MAG: FIST N-terminal domain-containing protein, partial [Desulfobaccales bacterium]